MATAAELDKAKEKLAKQKDLYMLKGGTFHDWLGKKPGTALTESDINKGLKSSSPHIVKLAELAKKKLKKIDATKKISSESVFTDLNSLRINSSIVSMEAMAGGNLTILLNDTIPNMVSDLKSFFNQFMPDAPGITIGINERNFIKSLSAHVYLDIKPLAAFVPEGMDTTYLKYSKVLLKAATRASDVITYLNNYSLYLGTLINNHDAKFSTSILTTGDSKYSDLLVLNEEIGKCFKVGSTRAEVSIGNVIDRNSDWESVFTEINSILNLVQSVDRSVLNKKIKEVSELLDVILDKIKRGELEGISAQGIHNLSNGAYLLAREVEHFGITYYRVLAFSNAVENTVKHYNKVFDL